jgi:hypothetical protein
MRATVNPSNGMKSLLPARACAVLVLLAAAGAARADGDRRQAVPLLPKYRSECAACHVAYPPGMLPAASWQRLMQGLPQHFGTDASLDPVTVGELSRWLVASSGASWRAQEAPPQDRITQSGWFQREHRKLADATWKLPAVKGPSNCAACHTAADQGDFDEHTVRIPR